METEQLRACRLNPESERRLIDADKTARVEGDEEEIVPALEHAAHGGRVVLVAVAQAADAGDAQRGRHGQNQNERRNFSPTGNGALVEPRERVFGAHLGPDDPEPVAERRSGGLIGSHVRLSSPVHGAAGAALTLRLETGHWKPMNAICGCSQARYRLSSDFNVSALS